MASAYCENWVTAAIADPHAAAELLHPLSTTTLLTVTPTTGSLPVADGAVTIANTATPTVVELLEFCVELNAKIIAMRAKLV